MKKDKSCADTVTLDITDPTTAIFLARLVDKGMASTEIDNNLGEKELKAKFTHNDGKVNIVLQAKTLGFFCCHTD
jgi:hypothetical protein